MAESGSEAVQRGAKVVHSGSEVVQRGASGVAVERACWRELDLEVAWTQGCDFLWALLAKPHRSRIVHLLERQSQSPITAVRWRRPAALDAQFPTAAALMACRVTACRRRLCLLCQCEPMRFNKLCTSPSFIPGPGPRRMPVAGLLGLSCRLAASALRSSAGALAD